MGSKNRLQAFKLNRSADESADAFGIIGEVKRFLHLESDEKITTLQQLYVEQLKDLFSAETQLIEALPQMAEAAHSPVLKKGFKTHLIETRVQAKRLQRILKSLGEKPGGKTCHAMKGLIKEGSEAIHEDATPALKDVALIAAAQRVEHYEIAGYGCVRTYATLLGWKADALVLETSLKEEAATDKHLSTAAKTLNLKAPHGPQSKKQRKVS